MQGNDMNDTHPSACAMQPHLKHAVCWCWCYCCWGVWCMLTWHPQPLVHTRLTTATTLPPSFPTQPRFD
jgi:hypothetical protein